MDKRDLLDKYGLTEAQLKDLLVKSQPDQRPVIRKYFDGKRFKFAVVADTHLCSKYERLDALKTFYQLCKRQGISDVYHAGDIITGQKLFRGQEYEVHTIGVDNQIEYCVNNYPCIDGIQTHYILGNHEMSYYNELGIDVGTRISQRRDDLIYLGQWQADVFINDVQMRLLHPSKGNA